MRFVFLLGLDSYLSIESREILETGKSDCVE